MLILLRQNGILPRQVLIHFGEDIQDLHRLFLLGIRFPELEQFARSEGITLPFKLVHTGLQRLHLLGESRQLCGHLWQRGQACGPRDHRIQPGNTGLMIVMLSPATSS
jgi:hypothetical protein